MLSPMNSINHTINGLASSLLLNVGLTQLAQKLDPITSGEKFNVLPNNGGTSYTIPSQFTAKKVG
jgi:hypothetical protein